MIIVPQSHAVTHPDPSDPAQWSAMLRRIERAGRVCYKSEARITDDSAAPFVRRLIASKHESVIEHEKITVHFVTSRGVADEFMRARIATHSCESTRYCNYGKAGGVTFAKPIDLKARDVWEDACRYAEGAYLRMLERGDPPEKARDVLGLGVKAEFVTTLNLRAWRHTLSLRVAKTAHPYMRALMLPLLAELRALLPAVFEDIGGEA